MQDATGGEPVQLTKDNDTYIRSFELSPDSKTLVYTDRKNRVNLLDIATKQVTTLLQDPMGEPRGVTFSPDSKWLTYTRTGNNEYSIVYVYNLVDRKEYPVTDKWYDSSSPVFSTDGKYLVLHLPGTSIRPTDHWNGTMSIIICMEFTWRCCPKTLLRLS